MILNDKWYNIFKWFVQIFLPAFGAAYFALSDYWDLPRALEVVGTCSVFAIFLGTILGISTKNYNNSDERFDGDMVITESEDGATYRLELNTPPEQLAEKDTISFKKITQVQEV